MLRLITFASLFASPFLSSTAHAFPENVRHGYVNCTSCHVAPTGGGTLTPYGRALSSELMSTWSYKNEEGFLHGAIKEDKMPEWLMIGGDLRAVQTLKDSKSTTDARWIPMQEDIEAAVKYKNVTLDVEFGHIENPVKKRWGSRRFFAMYNITDEWTVRAGRFYPQFGLYIPDHYTLPRVNLGFNEDQEQNAVEVAWNGENWSAFATASQQATDLFGPKESMFSAQLNKNLGDSTKVGASVLAGNSDLANRQVLGVHGIIGFSKRLFLLSEFDHQWATDKTKSAESRGFFAFNRLGYELTKGLIVFGQAEYGQANIMAGMTAQDAYGPGIQFFPRPHFELEGVWRKARSRSTGADFYDYGFLLLHYYW